MNLNRPCTNTNRVVALLVMLSFTFPLSFAEGVPFEEWLPGDVVFLVAYDSAHDSQVEFPNFSEGVTQWMETLDDIFEFRVAKEFISLTQDRTHLNQDFSALVGDRFTMTIRGLDPGAAKLPSFFFLSEVADPGKADEVLQSCFESVSALTGKARMDVDAYNGHVIRSLSGPVVIPGLELSYTIIDSLLILSSSKPAIIGLLQDREYEENRLADNVVYQKVLENLPDNRQLTFFVDFNSITQTVSQVLEFISLIQGEEATSNKELIKLIEAIPLLSLPCCPGFWNAVELRTRAPSPGFSISWWRVTTWTSPFPMRSGESWTGTLSFPANWPSSTTIRPLMCSSPYPDW